MKRLPPNSLLPTPEAARYAYVNRDTLRRHAQPVRSLNSGKGGRPVNLWRVSDLDRIRETVSRSYRKGGEA